MSVAHGKVTHAARAHRVDTAFASPGGLGLEDELIPAGRVSVAAGFRVLM